MPGYTHLQRAQPVYLSHHLLAYVWMLVRDRERFDARGRGDRGRCRSAPARWPASTSTPTAQSVAAALGFAGVAPNSIDAVSNRDFVLDYLAAAATCATHLSRLGAELVLWSSEEFGFCEVSDAWASGSSIMPQKKNPDAAELLRAKAPRVAAPPVGAARRDARPAADLQQGHAGGQGAPVRRRRHARAVPRRGRRDDRARSRSTASGSPRRPPTSSSPRPTSPTCWSGAGMPFREAHGVVAGLVRRRGRRRQAAVGAHARGAGRASRRCSTTSSTRCCATARGSSPRCRRAAPSLARVREQLDARARRSLMPALASPRDCRGASTSGRCSRSRATWSAASSPTASAPG